MEDERAFNRVFTALFNAPGVGLRATSAWLVDGGRVGRFLIPWFVGNSLLAWFAPILLKFLYLSGHNSLNCSMKCLDLLITLPKPRPILLLGNETSEKICIGVVVVSIVLSTCCTNTALTLLVSRRIAFANLAERIQSAGIGSRDAAYLSNLILKEMAV